MKMNPGITNLERKVGVNLSKFLLEMDRLTLNIAECDIEVTNNKMCQYVVGVLTRMFELEHLTTTNELCYMAERVTQIMLNNGASLRHINYVEDIVEYMIAYNEYAS